jgi:archaellum component FlaC
LWLLKLVSFSLLASIIYIDIHIIYIKNRKHIVGAALLLLFLLSSWSVFKTTSRLPAPTGGADVQQIYYDLKTHLDSELDKLSFAANQVKQSEKEELREVLNRVVANVSDQLSNLKGELQKESSVFKPDESVNKAIASISSAIAQIEREVKGIKDSNEGLSTSLASLRDIQNSLNSVMSSIETLRAHHSKSLEDYKSLKQSFSDFVSKSDFKDSLDLEVTIWGNFSLISLSVDNATKN